MAARLVHVDRFNIADESTQMRVAIDKATVDEYVEHLRDGVALPPVVAFFDGEKCWIADGWHRILAHKKANKTAVLADVRPGGQRDALLFSAGANAVHGLRRKRADKRKSVGMALDDPEWSKLGDTEIARMCAVTRQFVYTMRMERQAEKERGALASAEDAGPDMGTVPSPRELIASWRADLQSGVDEGGANAAAWRSLAERARELLDKAIAEEDALRQQLEWATRQLRRCCRALGVSDADLSKVAPMVEALARGT